MDKNTTTTVEALVASQEVTLVIEQFLNENYRFRRNVLNGKVEFAILPKWDGQNHIARIFGRIPGITSEQLNYLTIWLRSAVAHWMQMDMLHGNECVPSAEGCHRLASLHLHPDS